jgi:hypothetical protein
MNCVYEGDLFYMLELAKKYEEQLKQIFYDIALDSNFRWQWLIPGFEWVAPSDKTAEKLDLVSTFNGKVLGEMGYRVEVSSRSAYHFYAAHFSKDNGFIFMKDLITCIKDIFEKYRLNKFSCSVIIGNPAEAIWDKLILQYGGRVIGYCEQDACLSDGQLYDVKWYELLAKNYVAAKSEVIKRSAMQKEAKHD